jgi:hypothetical protein
MPRLFYHHPRLIWLPVLVLMFAVWLLPLPGAAHAATHEIKLEHHSMNTRRAVCGLTRATG